MRWEAWFGGLWRGGTLHFGCFWCHAPRQALILPWRKGKNNVWGTTDREGFAIFVFFDSFRDPVEE